MGQMRILNGSGDTVVEWSTTDETSVAEAAELFLALQAERRLPFARRAGEPAADATKIKQFDPTVEEIVWVRPITGG